MICIKQLRDFQNVMKRRILSIDGKRKTLPMVLISKYGIKTLKRQQKVLVIHKEVFGDSTYSMREEDAIHTMF
jgi:hypothetical protein